jgi:ATP-binding cassette subfamily F protein uup
MPLVTLRELTFGFGGVPLLDSVSCQIDEGQRIGLLGRNGAGKTTLMRLIAGEVDPDSGEIIVETGKRVARLQQDVPQDIQGTIFDLVRRGVPESWLEDHDEWKSQNPVDQILTRMQLDGALHFQDLSSGMKRRVLLARALVAQPDLLLLDEPTNHLDISAIEWLEQFLLRSATTLMFVTHDRMFLRRMANRILEIDRGRIFDWSCDYETFLERKQQALEAEEKENALFDKRLAEEEIWIRKGIKARRTRNEGRVKALKRLREERSRRREKLGTTDLQIQQGQRSGSLVIEAQDVAFKFENGPEIIRDFSTTIMRGDKVGIIGPNGAGKTTLLNILLGSLKPDSGKVRLGTNLEIAYFDQLRQQLDGNKSVVENVGDGYDQIQIGNVKKHIYGYLQDFLFTPERARTEVRFLSGGECNRILLAKLFAKTANLIVLDEPTNDLDAETLEMLEERLVNFEGTIIVVSHDREFLNRVVTSSIVFENGNVKEYVGGYDDWLRQRPETLPSESRKPKPQSPKIEPPKNSGVRKLKYSEKKELEALPEKIERLELRSSQLHQAMADPAFYQQPGTVIAERKAELGSLEAEIKAAYLRWEELEQLNS